MKDVSEVQRLLDEVEQMRTELESSLEENARILEDRDRLLGRVTTLARELQAANAAYSKPDPVRSRADLASEARQSQTDEELRVAFEELQVVTEELEVANTTLQSANAMLEQRVEERTGELARTNAALQKSEAAFRTLVEGMPQLAWRSQGGGVWTWCSPQWCAYTGQTGHDSLGLGWLDAIHPDDRPAAMSAWNDAPTRRVLQFEGRIFHAPEGRHRHFHTRAAPVLGEDGGVVEWLGTSTDVDDMIRLHQRQGVLVDELQHRTRNLMAVVQAVMIRTLKDSKSLAEFRHSIDERMQALARAQGLLSRRGSGKVVFDDLLFQELSAQVRLDLGGQGARVSTKGPRGVPLPSTSVQTLSLALHELTTNASKYGALASLNGHLDVTWSLSRVEGKAWLHIGWTETGVPNMPEAGSPPQGGGYGRELIERALPYQLGARTEYVFAEDGVRCTIDVEALGEGS